MEELAIKIRIYDRQYPMKVQPQDEALVRKAAHYMNEKIKSYREQFGITDIQDLLTMVAFDCLVDSQKATIKTLADHQILTSRIDGMIQSIDGAM